MTKGNPKIPKISTELLEWLEWAFQFRLPDVDTPERQLWFDVGAQRVVKKVRSLYEEQNRTVLGPDSEQSI